MTGSCPTDEELERLLGDRLTAAEEQVIEVHVAGCAACQRCLDQFTRCALTLPPRAAILVRVREGTPQGCGVLELAAQALPDAVRFPAPDDGPWDGVGPVSLPPAFDRYRVERALGSGGFGTVYLAHDTQLDRPVALKVLHDTPGGPPAARESLLQEARRVARLRHPGIVAVHDAGVIDGRVYVVSDFLDGPSLSQWLKGHRPTWPEAARIAAAVADALAHAHARLTVHRDVKPANIILTADGAPVLVDFGLGLDEAKAGGREFGVLSGTPWYMSPEQAAGAAHRIDGRTDVYSLGVVLYEMLCGMVPFRANDLPELLRQVRDDEPQPPRQLVHDLPPELERACLKALAKRPQDRYTTATDFAEELRRGPASRRSGLGAERRQVTVLACGCNLFESDEFLERCDVEAQAGILKAFQQACVTVVGRFDGTVVQCDQQGLLACFGYPVAHADAARRAARAVLSVLEELAALGDRLLGEQHLKLGPWGGLHTGPAVVEMGEASISLVGEARNVAVHLRDAAGPGQALCTGATHRLLAGRFDCVTRGARKIKGASQPVTLFRIRGVSKAPDRIEAAGLTPLTGRDHEVSLLKDRWEQAQEGMGQVVLIIGESGLGKSRLVSTLKQHVQERGTGAVPAVVEWRCSSHHQNTDLYPARDFFERFLGFGRDETAAARFGRLVRHLDEFGLARPGFVPPFASLLSLTLDDRFPPPHLPPVRERDATLRALGEWLRVYAGRRPVLFVVEDLHWVDPSTLEFLGQFLAEGLHDRVLTLLTSRPEFQTPWPAVAHQTCLALNRLTRRQVGDLMRKQTGRSDLAEALVEQVYDRTGGVPLFVEEFTKTAW